jgi:NTE family protein
MDADKTIKIEYETGLVLSGGAYRGIGQLGALQALQERGIRPDIICGTSSGALNAVLYASGYTPEEMYEIWQKEPMSKAFNVHFPYLGMLRHGKIGELAKSYMRYQRLEELPLPVLLTATCLNDGNQKVFEHGDLLRILEACCAVPLTFEPVEIEGRLYVDGGLVSNLPAEPLAGKCRRLIGVSANPIPYKEKIDGLTDTIYRTIWIGLESTVQKTRQLCDWIIAPVEWGQHGFMERSDMPEFFNVGYDYTTRFLDEKGY